MQISGRNQIDGTVKQVETSDLMAKVVVDIGQGKTITSIITKDAVEQLGLKAGDKVSALIKATEVMIIK